MKRHAILVFAWTLPNLTFAAQDMNSFYEKGAVKCAALSCIRKEIDRLNDTILLALAERTAFVKRAGDLKKDTKIANDPKRVAEIMEAIAEKARTLGVPEEIATRTFQTIIDQSIQFEQRYIDEKAN